MFQRITEFAVLSSGMGQSYQPRVYGRLRPDGMWEGFLVFFPLGGGSVISTPRETVQNNHFALEAWAHSLDRVYIEGALERALSATPGVPLSTLGGDIDAVERTAVADAVALHRAAERAGIAAASEAAAAEMHEDTAAAAREQSAQFRREQQEFEELADETTRAGAVATAAAHESAARSARSVAADVDRRKAARRRARAASERGKQDR